MLPVCLVSEPLGYELSRNSPTVGLPQASCPIVKRFRNLELTTLTLSSFRVIRNTKYYRQQRSGDIQQRDPLPGQRPLMATSSLRSQLATNSPQPKRANQIMNDHTADHNDGHRTPSPGRVPTNSEIEQVIQMAMTRTPPSGRAPSGKDTRTQLFVGNVRGCFR